MGKSYNQTNAKGWRPTMSEADVWHIYLTAWIFYVHWRVNYETAERRRKGKDHE
jgi:hypothetical protein